MYWIGYAVPQTSGYTTVGTLTAYGFVESREAKARLLLDVPHLLLEIQSFAKKLVGKLPRIPLGPDKETLNSCTFPEEYRQMYEAMEVAFVQGNPKVRVSMREGEVVFCDDPSGKHLNSMDLKIAMMQMKGSGITWPVSAADRNRAFPRKRPKPPKPLKLNLQPVLVW